MREYGKVSPTFWTGHTGMALRAHGPEAMLVALYLMTSPMSNMLGIFPQPVLYIGSETGLMEKGARKGLRACCDVGFARYDEATQTVWVVEMAAWQIAKQLKASDNRCVGIQKEYEALPKNPFLGPWFDHYEHVFHLKFRRDSEGPSKPLRSHEHEHEQEQEQDHEKDKRPSSTDKPPTPLVLDGTPQKPKAVAKAERLKQVTDDAISTFNASPLCKRNGGNLSSVNPTVGRAKREKQVARCIRTAQDISNSTTGSTVLTPDFWTGYWAAVDGDDFRAGRTAPGDGHKNWKPDFEYLTREDVMLKVFDSLPEEPDGD